MGKPCSFLVFSCLLFLLIPLGACTVVNVAETSTLIQKLDVNRDYESVSQEILANMVKCLPGKASLHQLTFGDGLFTDPTYEADITYADRENLNIGVAHVSVMSTKTGALVSVFVSPAFQNWKEFGTLIEKWGQGGKDCGVPLNSSPGVNPVSTIYFN